MKFKSIFIALLTVLLIVSCVPDTSKTTIYLVRHAEKDLSDTTDNPALTMKGESRAIHLMELFKKDSVHGIYSTKYDRNINTVQPLADLKELEIGIFDWYEWQPMMDNVLKEKNKTFVICGHGDNLLPMIEYAKGKKPQESLAHDEYDKIFKLEVYKDSTNVKVIVF